MAAQKGLPEPPPIGTSALPAGTFAGTSVFVTGGGTGLGKAIASEFGRLGADLVIASRKPDHLDAGRQAIDALGQDGYDTAFATGAGLTTADAIAYARRARGERKRPSRGWDSLTPTELIVIRHVTAGLTNPQIADRMFIASGTVKVHLSHIFAKLGVDTRSQLAAEAARRGPPTADTARTDVK